MKKYAIQAVPGTVQWRTLAREAYYNGLEPCDVRFEPSPYPEPSFRVSSSIDLGVVSREHLAVSSSDQHQLSLFEPEAPPVRPAIPHLPQKPLSIPKGFERLIQTVSCHRDIERFNLLYRVLWRLQVETSTLLYRMNDDDMACLHHMAKAVGRDRYKITAFLRFRETPVATPVGNASGRQPMSHFVAWYEPEHYTLELAVPFFKTRFMNMRWSILTPYRSAHWDTQTLRYTPAPEKDLRPEHDDFEALWCDYYRSIFNPARLKVNAMLNQMPKKYWKNLPEAALIPELVNSAHGQVQQMIENTAVCTRSGKY